MTRQFKIGDRVRTIRGIRVGAVATVVSALFPARIGLESNWLGILQNGTLVHELDLPVPPGERCAYPPEFLEPYYDGNETAEWCELTRRLCRTKERT
jgi:hypothetical protein